MNWFLFAIVSPFLSALVNYIDKYLIEKVARGRGVGSLIIFSALMGLPVAFLILVFGPNVFTPSINNILLIMLNGSFYVAWVLPYLYALQKDDTSSVVPIILQFSSVFALLLGVIFLGEVLTLRQLVGCGFVFAGGMGLILRRDKNLAKRKYVFNKEVFILSLISCFFIAISGIIFKHVALKESFWVASFWESLGIFITAIFLFCVKSYREQFLKVLKANKVKVLSLNLLNESLVTVGRVSLNYATMLAPVALVYFVDSGFQPFLVFAIGVFFSLFFPNIVKEDISKDRIMVKFLSMLVMFMGVYLMWF